MPQIFYRPPSPTKPKPVPGIVTIKQHQPWLCPLMVVLAIIIIGILGWILYQNRLQTVWQNKRTFIEQHLQTQEHNRQQLEKVIQKNTSLEVQNKELRQKLTAIVRTTQESQQTYAEVLQSLSQLQEENRDLKEELTFYKFILISPNSSKSTAQAEMTNFSLTYEEETGYYPYKLVLTQRAKKAQVIEGLVQIDLVGQTNNKTERLKMASITDNQIEALDYKFIYFQRIEDYLQIPEDFKPFELIIRILPKNQKNLNEIRLRWEDLQPKEQPEHVGKP
jgi:regulator of replication initiation timing